MRLGASNMLLTAWILGAPMVIEEANLASFSPHNLLDWRDIQCGSSSISVSILLELSYLQQS